MNISKEVKYLLIAVVLSVSLSLFITLSFLNTTQSSNNKSISGKWIKDVNIEKNKSTVLDFDVQNYRTVYLSFYNLDLNSCLVQVRFLTIINSRYPLMFEDEFMLTERYIFRKYEIIGSIMVIEIFNNLNKTVSLTVAGYTTGE